MILGNKFDVSLHYFDFVYTTIEIVVKSLRTSLALRTHFEVLGLEGQVLGLETSSPQKLRCLRSRTALFFELLKFFRSPEKFARTHLFWSSLEKFVWRPFFSKIAWKSVLKTFFLGKHLRLCPWCLALALSIPVLGLERVCSRKGCSWPRAFCPRLHLCIRMTELKSLYMPGWPLDWKTKRFLLGLFCVYSLFFVYFVR